MDPALSRFLSLTEGEQLAEIHLLRDQPKVLRLLRDQLGIRECPVDCLPEREACPKHDLWRKWRADGLGDAAIAERWMNHFFERATRYQVGKFFAAGGESCNCPLPYKKCPHMPADAGCALSIDVFAFLLFTLKPQAFHLPPPPDAGVICKSFRQKVPIFGARRRAKRSLFHPGDFPQRPLRRWSA
jgi:hypothetical protein